MEKRIFTAKAAQRVGERVKLAGWIATRRDHGKLVFLDLRDKEGLMQLVLTPKEKAPYETAQHLSSECVVEVHGTVRERPENMRNPELETGNVEVQVDSLLVLAVADQLPIPIDTAGYEIDEEKRLRWRYLDLRRSRLHENLVLRHKMAQFLRGKLMEVGFVEIETPLLTRSTPEGARDFLVPSRLQPGKFFALPQSPQQYKQLLQVAGFERYFQFARALRDEDPRGDRQAEHTQLDIEMSFVEQEDILQLVEDIYKELVRTLFPEKRIQKDPFPRIPYKETMEKWDTDRPDLRKNKEDSDELAFVFVVDFPAFEWKEREKRWDAVHHPFTKPQTDSMEEIKKDPAKVRAWQYDLVLNGHEVGGGSLRITDPKFLEEVFAFMGNKREEVREKFGHLLEAFRYGVPPHGGMAMGFDRLCSVLMKEPNIREVIAFPKTGDNRDLMMGAPSEVSEEQLKELHIKTEKKKSPKKNA
ncbi:aspartate--tRNA ligase [Patescibacteria group bacterium]|nr:aspartate--tRNA ligase [Patescibacteria group bacterium]